MVKKDGLILENSVPLCPISRCNPREGEKLNNKISPIQYDYIEKYLAEKPYHGDTIRCPRH